MGAFLQTPKPIPWSFESPIAGGPHLVFDAVSKVPRDYRPKSRSCSSAIRPISATFAPFAGASALSACE